MSWSASVPPTAPAEFAAAVDSCVTSVPEDQFAPEPKAQLAAARAAVKELAAAVLTEDAGDKLIQASLAGHACVEGESGLDSVNINLTQQNPA